MAVKKGLGRGLDSLIPTGVMDNSNQQNAEKVSPDMYVKITKVEPNRDQPRKIFDEDALQELSDSIKQFGVISPILVQERDDYYQIIAGERRWRAAKLAGLKEIPVIIRDYTEKEIEEISLIENLQRKDLNPIEEAQAYKRLMENYSLKQDELAERVSKSRTAITNTMRLLKLSDKVQEMLINELITSGHARALLAIEDPEQQYVLAQQAFDQGLSVRDVEKLVKKKNEPKKEKKEKPYKDSLYTDIEEKLKSSLGTKVSIMSKNENSGKIEIEYYTKDDLQKILDLLLTEE